MNDPSDGMNKKYVTLRILLLHMCYADVIVTSESLAVNELPIKGANQRSGAFYSNDEFETNDM